MATPSLKDDAAHSIKKATGNTSAIDVSEGQVLNKVLTNTEIDPAHLEALRNYVPGTDLEKRLLRKLDLRLVPTLWLMCVLCFMDRSNIVRTPFLSQLPQPPPLTRASRATPTQPAWERTCP